MVKAYRFKQALHQQRVLVGMNLGTPAPVLVEILGRAGYDYVFIDTSTHRFASTSFRPWCTPPR